MQKLSTLRVVFWLAATACPVSAATDGVPKLDVSQSCQAARSFAGSGKDLIPTALGISYKDLTFQRCVQDEKAAHAQLVARWSHFNLADRRDCLGQGRSPVPSYVEILTCLQMAEYVRAFDIPGNGAAHPQGSISPEIPSESLTGLSR